MRLERQQDAAIRPTLTDGFERGGQLGRVMTVVIDERDAPRRGLHIAILLQATIDAMERRQRRLNRRVADIQFFRDRNRGQRIEHVVRAGKIQLHRQRLRAAATLHIEARLHALAHDVHRTNVGVALDAVSHEGTRDARHQALRDRIVGAHDRQPVERQVVQEVDEALLQPLEVAVVRARDDRCRRW